ncbi:MAG TPA: hypothetical protein VFD65_05775 [Chitinophagales bacterium]|nr:hypothetical protein [Chitinophagales bacterium]
MKTNSLLILLTLLCFNIAQGNEWVAQKISGSITVYFPQVPVRSDTANQSIYFLSEGKEHLLASVAPIPDSLKPQNDLQADTLLNNYIQSVIIGATPLIYTNVEFQDIPAKYYTVRMDNERSPNHGLVVDSYTLIYLDTIYSFSFFRYNATQLYNYNKQRKFFDMIKIEKITPSTSDSLTREQTVISTTNQSSERSYPIWIFVSIISSIAILSISWYWLKKKK